MNTCNIRILSYQKPQGETFRYWCLSHFPHLSSIEVISLHDNNSIPPPYSGLTLLLLLNEADIIRASFINKKCSEPPIIIYHHLIQGRISLFRGEKYPLHECMTYLEKKLHVAYEIEEEREVSFTRREKEVLELFAQGMSVKEVAYNLQISPYTVATHQRSLYLKTKSHSLQQLTLYASMEYKRGE